MLKKRKLTTAAALKHNAMNNKQILLTAIRNSWPATIGRTQLVTVASKEYSIDPSEADEIVSESLKKGEISVEDNRLRLQYLGYEYPGNILNNQSNNLFTKNKNDEH